MYKKIHFYFCGNFRLLYEIVFQRKKTCEIDSVLLIVFKGIKIKLLRIDFLVTKNISKTKLTVGTQWIEKSLPLCLGWQRPFQVAS
jgi:hypothetical protein